MSLTLEPAELGFRRPFTHEVTQNLRLTNKSNHPLAFKVKTTAPKQYCVRPNSGRVEPGHGVDVQVLLQAMKEDPPPDARCRDKFLVQSIPITPERETGAITSIWQNVEKIAKDQIEERKIRVVFLPAEDAVSTPSHRKTNGIAGDPPAYESTSPSYSSPQQAATPNTQPSSREAQSVIDSETSGKARPAPNVATNANESVRGELAQANNKIHSLTTQVEDQALRQRKTDAINQDSRERITTGTTSQGIQSQSSDGVPVQMVAALCLLSFLLAYFFF